MDYGDWHISNFEDVERVLNILHRRSVRDKTDIEILTAKLDLLTTPWWNPRARRRAKRWIAVLTKERAED